MGYGNTARTEAVVLAAERSRIAEHTKFVIQPPRIRQGMVSSPAVARADADNGNGGTREADEGVDVLDDHAEAREDLRDRRVARRSRRLAALDRAGSACARRLATGHGGGGGKDGERGEREEELGEHDACFVGLNTASVCVRVRAPGVESEVLYGLEGGRGPRAPRLGPYTGRSLSSDALLMSCILTSDEERSSCQGESNDCASSKQAATSVGGPRAVLPTCAPQTRGGTEVLPPAAAE